MEMPALRNFALATLCAAALAVTPGAALAGVVVSASGPSAGTYPVGRKLGDNDPIVLRAGDTLTVLEGSGTRVLRGAGTYTLGQKRGANTSSTFAVLTERRSARRARTGAVRAGDLDTPVRSPNLWYVDVGASGRMCLAETDRVRLWRRNTEDDATYSIRDASGGGNAERVIFMDGEMLAPWDTRALPVTNGSSYRIAEASGGGDREITFVVLDTVADDPEALATQLIENGCTTQLELLSEATLIAEG